MPGHHPIDRSDYSIIDIVHTRGIQSIPAKIVGDFGIHVAGDGFSVTHIGTGLRVSGAATREEAVGVAKSLAGLDWGFDDPGNIPARTREAAEGILKRKFMPSARIVVWRHLMSVKNKGA